MRDRGLADDRQEKLERTNKQRATDLEDRELVQKEKLMARREARQEAADDDRRTRPGRGRRALSAFDHSPMDGSDLDLEKRLRPCCSARTARNAVLRVASSTFFGTPGSGKSWVALMVHP